MKNDKIGNNVLVIKNKNELKSYNLNNPIELFSYGISKKIDTTEKIIQDIIKFVANESPVLAMEIKSNKKGFRYVVDATQSTLDAIDKGLIKLTTNKSGKTFAQIRNSTGRFGSKIPIKKEVFKEEIDPVNFANAIQMKSFQNQLDIIQEQIISIDQSIGEVIHGLENDRISLFYSGMSLYQEALLIEDNDFRKNLISQSLKSLSDASFQLNLSLQKDINYLINGEYNNVKSKRVELIDSKMSSLNNSFSIIHQANILKAAIYCNENEFSAMSSVLNNYSNFIENTIAKNSNLLAQCDLNDNGTIEGVWKSRANLKIDKINLNNSIDNLDKTIYLEILEEK